MKEKLTGSPLIPSIPLSPLMPGGPCNPAMPGGPGGPGGPEICFPLKKCLFFIAITRQLNISFLFCFISL